MLIYRLIFVWKNSYERILKYINNDKIYRSIQIVPLQQTGGLQLPLYFNIKCKRWYTVTVWHLLITLKDMVIIIVLLGPEKRMNVVKLSYEEIP